MARRYFLTFCILTSCLVAGQPPQYALKGQKVALKPDAGAQPDGFLWKHDGNKVVEFNGNEEHVYNPYKNRITLDWVSAEINITDLRFEDSGEYELEQFINKRLHRSFYRLEVIDKVSKPTIRCEMNNGSGSLVCSAEPSPPQSQFKWTSLGKVQLGPMLPIPLGEKHDDEVHICTVSNLLSNETAEFTAKDCYTDKSSSTTPIASLVSIFAVLILVGLGIGLLFCKLRHKACFANDVENQPQPGTTEACFHAKDLEKQSPRITAEELQAARSRQESFKKVRDPDAGSNHQEDADSHLDNEKSPLQKLIEKFDQNNDGQTRTRKFPTGSDKRKALWEENKGLLDTTHTLPSPQPLRQTNEPATSQEDIDLDLDTVKENNIDDHKRTASPQSSPHIESPSPLDLNNVAGKDKADEDAEQPAEHAEEKVPAYDAEDSEKENEPDPAKVSDDSKSDQELYNEPELQGSKTTLSEHDSELSEEPEKEADEDEEAPSAPATAEASPPAQQRSPSTENSPNVAPEDTAGEHKDGANSDQVTGENVEENVKESDSSDAGEIKEPDDLSEDKQSSTVPEQKGSETPREQDSNLPKEEPPTEEDNKQDTVEPVSENENKTNSQGAVEDMDKDLQEDEDQDLQPQSPTSTKPDNRSQESPEKDKESGHDSDESEGQSEKDETVEDKNEVQGDPQEEKPVNESLSEDKEGLKK